MRAGAAPQMSHAAGKPTGRSLGEGHRWNAGDERLHRQQFGHEFWTRGAFNCPTDEERGANLGELALPCGQVGLVP